MLQKSTDYEKLKENPDFDHFMIDSLTGWYLIDVQIIGLMF